MRSIALVLVVILAAACSSSNETASQAPATTQAPANGLTSIDDPSLVCMVNNAYMGKPQIPVEVDGKTYFGCCEMCKGRLQTDPAARTAVDPVTGESVDKASAVIAKDADGNILYFASRQSMEAFR